MTGGRLAGVRRWVLATLVLGLAGSAVELLLLEHYEDPWQFVPLVLLGAGMAALGWDLARPSPLALQLFRGTMGLFVAAGLLGIALHMRGAAEFQREIDPTMAPMTLLAKVLRAKAPPALAPGLMIQLGLLGLAFTFTRETHS